jgi:hypothetical protein
VVAANLVALYSCNEYSVIMKKNVTISLDLDLLEKSRGYAQRNRLSLNSLVSNLLRDTVGSTSKVQMQRILDNLGRFQGDSKGKKWRREDLYDR